MGYESLKDIYYKDNQNYESLYQTRFQSLSTVKLPLSIKTKHENTYQLFYVNLPEITELIEEIGQTINTRVLLKEDNIPKNFWEAYINKLMIDEIKTTNEIEGVYTKKEDLEKALSNIDDSSKQFHFIVNKYHKLISDQEIKLKTSKDIRIIYDELLTQEIQERDLLDGKIFRKGPVSVYRRSGNSEPIHQGVLPEERIIEAVDNLLLFLNTAKDSYIKIAVCHYYLGYIHPFYDGNGRLSRFISTGLLFKKHDKLLALKLSKTIKDNRKEYDEMFELTNNEYNRGDMTSFILMFLRVLNQASKEINKEVEIYDNQLKEIELFLNLNSSFDNDVENNIIYLIYQGKIFDKKINTKEVAKYLGKKEDASRKYVKKIENKGYITRGKQGDNNHLYITKKLEEEMKHFFDVLDLKVKKS